MKYEVKEEPKCKKTISITLDGQDTDAFHKEALKKYKNEAAIDGYRKGKAPDEVIVSRYGGKIKEEVINKVVPQKGSEALQELGLHVVTYPSIKDVKETEDGLSFELVVETAPDFELSDYSDIKVKKKKLKEITEKDISREVDKVRQSRASLKDTGRDTAQNGDYVNFSMVGFMDGKAQSELSGDNERIQIGKKMVPDDLDKGIEGMKTGEEKEINVKFPEDYFNKKFAGKEAVIKVTLKGIKELELPELNDEFVKSLGGELKTVDSLKGAVKENLKRQAETEVKNSGMESIFKELLKRNDFDVAEGLIQQEMDNIMARHENNLKQQGLDLEKLGIDKKEIREKNREQAANNVRLRYILRKIAEKENIEASDSDIENEIKKVAENTRENYDDILKRAKASWEPLKAQLLEDKVIERLLTITGAK